MLFFYYCFVFYSIHSLTHSLIHSLTHSPLFFWIEQTHQRAKSSFVSFVSFSSNATIPINSNDRTEHQNRASTTSWSAFLFSFKNTPKNAFFASSTDTLFGQSLNNPYKTPKSSWLLWIGRENAFEALPVWPFVLLDPSEWQQEQGKYDSGYSKPSTICFRFDKWSSLRVGGESTCRNEFSGKLSAINASKMQKKELFSEGLMRSELSRCFYIEPIEFEQLWSGHEARDTTKPLRALSFLGSFRWAARELCANDLEWIGVGIVKARLWGATRFYKPKCNETGKEWKHRGGFRDDQVIDRRRKRPARIGTTKWHGCEFRWTKIAVGMKTEYNWM